MKQAFTLIELLVVVLIIGILSAIALPQYELAVKKTRVIALLPVMKAIDQAQTEYFLANGSYAASFDDLAVELPGNFTTEFVWGADQNQCYFPTASSVQCQVKSVRNEITLEKYYNWRTYICWPEGTTGKKICQNLANTKDADVCTSRGCAGYTFTF